MTITRSHPRPASFATALVLFLLYLVSLAPSVSFIDAGELSAVAYTFGVAHPTGYPLFTLIAGLWSHIPAGEVILRLNTLAALLAAIGAGIFVHVIWHLLGAAVKRKPAAKSTVKGKSAQQSAPLLGDDLRLLLSVFGALIIGLSETYWKTALAIEVYSLHLPLLALALLTFVTAHFDETLDERSRERRFLAAAFTLGLSFTNHMTTILLLPAFLVIHFRSEGFGARTWKRLARLLPMFAAGLLPYLYLPIRAAAQPALNWGNPADLDRLLWHVSGKQYRVWIFTSMEAARRQFSLFIDTLPAEFAYAGLALAVVGCIAAFRANRRVGLFLALLFAGCVGYAINYDIHDIESYFLLAYIVTGIWAAYGLHAALRWFKAGNTRTALLAAVLLVGLAAGAQYSRVSERGNYLVEDYTKNMLASFEPRALVLSYQWDYWVSASYYYQFVEGQRPDVIVIDKELLRRSWYLAQLRRNHPEFAARSQKEIDAFLEDLTLFEHELPYDPGRIEDRFNAMINSFVTRNINDRPVYMTVEMEQHFAPGFTRVPEGLAFRLYPAGVPVQSAPRFSLTDVQARPFERTERLSTSLWEMYPLMLTNRGIWLYQQARYREAAGFFDTALRFEPGYRAAYEWRARNSQAMTLGDAGSSVTDASTN
ncbi:MAG: DUF2723 domain-containing protein [Ignavibacteriae bacterium]|nr:DUF2723 domain-containing protein [Ignavibacteriota bacterium]